jgi:chromate transporter
VHGLSLVAVAIVAQAVWSMARALCPDRQRASIAAAAAVMCLVGPSSMTQVVAIVWGGLAGLWLCRTAVAHSTVFIATRISRRVAVASLAVFMFLLVGLPALTVFAPSGGVALFGAFYRSGALVFGGGHVVLPLLREAVVAPGWVSDDVFVAGYGAAQAIPGPLFAFAAYLGAVVRTAPNGVAGAAVGLIGIFLPGMLVLIGALPFWQAFQKSARALAVTRGINAAVVGLLGAALYSPLWISSVGTPADLCIVLIGFVLLVAWRASPLLVVAVGALGGILLTAMGLHS